MKVLLLTWLQYLCIGGLSFTLPNGFPISSNWIPNGLLNALPNSFPRGIFNGMPNGVMSVPSGLRNSLPTLNVVDANSTKGQQNNTCCFGETCLSPCPFAPGGVMPMPMVMSMPLPPAPAPVVVPARAYYEPVVHNHPPLHKIKKLIKQGKERKRKRHRYESSADCSGTDTDADTESDSSGDTDSAVEYYDDVIHVNV